MVKMNNFYRSDCAIRRTFKEFGISIEIFGIW